MKKTLASLALLLSAVTLLPAATCAQAKQDAAVVLQYSQTACVLAHAFLPDVPAIAAACEIDQALAPEIEKLLQAGVEQKAIQPKGAAAKYARDAAADAR